MTGASNPPVADQDVIFVGGKGGVGKTTTASALALALAESGERVLLVSTDPAHSLGDLFDRDIGDAETELVSGLTALEIDPESEVERYLREVKRNLRELVRPEMYGDIDSQLELTRLSPGAQEAALLERTTGLMIETEDRFDRLVFDTAPTGSTLRLLSLPEVMTAWMEGLLERRERAESFRESLKGSWAEEMEERKRRESRSDPDGHERKAGGGRKEGTGAASGREAERARRIREVLDARRNRFARARRILTDPERAAFVLVVIPEKLPILEAHRAYVTLTEAGVPVSSLVVNRVLPDGDLGSFLEHRREQEAAYLQKIDTRFQGLDRIHVPLLEEDVGSLDGVRIVSRHLFAAAPMAPSRAP